MRHGNISLQQAVDIVEQLGGSHVVSAILQDKKFPPVKYGQVELGQLEALMNKCGGWEAVQAVLRGEKEVLLQDAAPPLFDHNGRRIPPPGFKASVVDADPNLDFTHGGDTWNYERRLSRLRDAFNLSTVGIGPVEFKDRTQTILEGLRAYGRVSNITEGAWFPIVIPEMQIADYGEALESQLLPAVERSYLDWFPERKFVNYPVGVLKGQVKIVHSSHERLLALLNQDEGSLPAVYFPNSLQGFSIPADREQIDTLPNNVLLCGGVDTCVAMAMYPDILARDAQTPGLDMAALEWQAYRHSLSFRARDNQLDFDLRHTTLAFKNYSGGLLVLG